MPGSERDHRTGWFGSQRILNNIRYIANKGVRFSFGVDAFVLYIEPFYGDRQKGGVHMKKKILSLTVMLAMTCMCLAGCGSSSGDSGNSGNQANAAAEDTESIIPEGEESQKLLEVRENGLEIGYANDIPYEYIDDDGNFTGFETEIIEAAAAKLGITKIVPVKTSWDTYAAELQQGKFDIFGCGVYVSDDRLEVMNMTNMTYNLKECIVVRKDSGIETIDDLKDKSVESTAGMLYMDVTQQAADDGTFGSAIVGGQPASLALDVQTKKADAAMMDIVMGAYLTSQDNMSDLKVLDNWQNMTDGKCAYLMNIKDTDFVKEFDQGLDAIKEDGTMQEILEKYGLGDSMIGVEEGQVELPER